MPPAASLHRTIAMLVHNPNPAMQQLAPLMQKKQLRELQQLLYEELSRTPEQGQAFTDVVRTVMDRETAFVSWKSEGAPEYWQKTEPGLPTVSDSERKTSCLWTPRSVYQSLQFCMTCRDRRRCIMDLHYRLILLACNHRKGCLWLSAASSSMIST